MTATVLNVGKGLSLEASLRRGAVRHNPVDSDDGAGLLPPLQGAHDQYYRRVHDSKNLYFILSRLANEKYFLLKDKIFILIGVNNQF